MKRQSLVGNIADLYGYEQNYRINQDYQSEEQKFSWGNCMSVKRQFPVNVASEQISKSPDQRLKQQHNYYIEEVKNNPSELKKM